MVTVYVLVLRRVEVVHWVGLVQLGVVGVADSLSSQSEVSTGRLGTSEGISTAEEDQSPLMLALARPKARATERTEARMLAVG